MQGFGQGSVIGAGFEKRGEAGVIEFFFTVEGQRLPSIPDHAGIFYVADIEKYYLEMIGSAPMMTVRECTCTENAVPRL